MPKFKVGDRVKRIGALLSDYMHNGMIVAVNPRAADAAFVQYEVDFKYIKAAFYENQLRLVTPSASLATHVSSGRLLELVRIKMNTPVDEPEWAHIQYCAECFTQFIRLLKAEYRKGPSAGSSN